MGRKKMKFSEQSVVVDTQGALSKQAKRMILYMKDQYALGDRHNLAEVKLTMEQSFKDRYNYILYQGPKVKQLRDKYPYLFQKEHFFAEFSRVTKGNVSWENYTRNLKKYCDTILFAIPRSNHVKKILHGLSDKQLSDDKKLYLRCAAAILVLPTLFMEHITSIAEFEAEGTASVYPQIICKSPFDSVLLEEPVFMLFVEEEKVFETSDFTEAVFLLIAAHYCFDIQYPEEFTQSTALIEQLLLQLPQEPGAPDSGIMVKEQMLFMTLMQEHKFPQA